MREWNRKCLIPGLSALIIVIVCGCGGSTTAQVITEDMHAGFDIAYNPVGNEVAFSYADAASRKVSLQKINLADGMQKRWIIGSASVGNTSLAYDANGTAHIIYFLNSTDDHDTFGTPENPRRPGIAEKHSDAANWQKLFYRRLEDGHWTDREEVAEGVASDSENVLLIPSTPGSRPFCLFLGITPDSAVSPILARREAANNWQISSLDPDQTGGSRFVDALTTDDRIYAVVHNSATGMLRLAEGSELTSLEPAWEYSEVFPAAGVTGHQSLIMIDENCIGIAYQVADTEDILSLQYGEYDLGTGLFTVDDSLDQYSGTGYHPSLSIDDSGMLIIMAVTLESGSIDLFYRTGDDWDVGGWSSCNSRADRNIYNTLDMVKANSRFYYVGMGISGQFVHGWMEF